MKLIVGLGNPGKEYENTRHNMGFMTIDKYAQTKNIAINISKFNGLYNVYNEGNEKIMLLKPQKYINLSGEVIKKYIDYFKIDIDDILIICDDLDLEVGRYRLRYKGSSGGHNGLKNIEQNILTKEYKRIKIGISNNKNIDTKDYVLGHLDSKTKDQIEKVIDEVVEVLDDYMNVSFDNLMNKYNK